MTVKEHLRFTIIFNITILCYYHVDYSITINFPKNG